MAEGDENNGIELKFRIFDGTDIGHRKYASSTTVASLKQRLVAEWPAGYPSYLSLLSFSRNGQSTKLHFLLSGHSWSCVDFEDHFYNLLRFVFLSVMHFQITNRHMMLLLRPLIYFKILKSLHLMDIN